MNCRIFPIEIISHSIIYAQFKSGGAWTYMVSQDSRVTVNFICQYHVRKFHMPISRVKFEFNYFRILIDWYSAWKTISLTALGRQQDTETRVRFFGKTTANERNSRTPRVNYATGSFPWLDEKFMMHGRLQELVFV